MKITPITDGQQGSGRKESAAVEEHRVEVEIHSDIENQTNNAQPRVGGSSTIGQPREGGLFCFLAFAVILFVLLVAFLIYWSTIDWYH